MKSSHKNFQRVGGRVIFNPKHFVEDFCSNLGKTMKKNCCKTHSIVCRNEGGGEGSKFENTGVSERMLINVLPGISAPSKTEVDAKVGFLSKRWQLRFSPRVFVG